MAGLLIRVFYREKEYFNFTGFDEPHNHDTDPNPLLRLLKNIGRNIRTGIFDFDEPLMLFLLDYVAVMGCLCSSGITWRKL